MSRQRSAERAIRRIVEQVVQGYRPQRVILFGSYAYGAPGRDSDIDLLIIRETDENPWQRRVRVRRLAADPDRRIPSRPFVLTLPNWNSVCRPATRFTRRSSRAARCCMPPADSTIPAEVRSVWTAGVFGPRKREATRSTRSTKDTKRSAPRPSRSSRFAPFAHLRAFVVLISRPRCRTRVRSDQGVDKGPSGW
jgi:predicted nucleotidyltransferase